MANDMNGRQADDTSRTDREVEIESNLIKAHNANVGGFWIHADVAHIGIAHEEPNLKMIAEAAATCGIRESLKLDEWHYEKLRDCAAYESHQNHCDTSIMELKEE